jgi:FkbH-like protein
MRIGWGAKSDSIREMAQELGLGLDAFVFVDDSPVECAEVASALPMVEVLRVPREAHRVPSLLANVRFFDASTRASEHSVRANHYALERARNEARAEHADLESFLTSLDLEATVGVPTSAELERVAELTQRTNQWNLTTVRYDIAQIEEMAASERFMIVALRARDRYGDYGLTGLGIAAFDELGNAHIDALLMSCRTLGRRLEDALLAEVIRSIRARAPNAEILAEFRPTHKNAQVAGFYDARGFVLVDSLTDENRRSYILGAATDIETPSFIRIRRTS